MVVHLLKQSSYTFRHRSIGGRQCYQHYNSVSILSLTPTSCSHEPSPARDALADMSHLVTIYAYKYGYGLECIWNCDMHNDLWRASDHGAIFF